MAYWSMSNWRTFQRLENVKTWLIHEQFFRAGIKFILWRFWTCRRMKCQGRVNVQSCASEWRFPGILERKRCASIHRQERLDTAGWLGGDSLFSRLISRPDMMRVISCVNNITPCLVRLLDSCKALATGVVMAYLLLLLDTARSLICFRQKNHISSWL